MPHVGVQTANIDGVMQPRMTRQADAAEPLAWLRDDRGGVEVGSVTGYDPSMWEDSVWLLHAMWETPAESPVSSFHDLHSRQIADGAVAPTVIGGVNLDDATVATGVPLGYAEVPGGGWSRLRWTDLAARLGIDLGVGQSVPPCFRWFPIRSWPVNIRPPTEGSLDQTSLHALLPVLARCSAGADETPCYAFYASLPAGVFDEPTLFSGPLAAVTDLVTGSDPMPATPSNLWPRDRSWFVYTDWDLWATRVSGPPRLVAELAATPGLETFAWTAPT
jgi:hypothetical protein